MCGRLRAGGQRHPILPERRHLDPERAADLRPGPVSDSGQSGQRQGDVHGRGLQVGRFVRVQVRVHDCRRCDQASFILLNTFHETERLVFIVNYILMLSKG